ncbi:MAG: hypothetical protein HY341_00010 [Candidatus Kerfeldbacteria bacterium]|nr:hypothetical protein [Candidatus Kerfeldbacteria bacterium]
MRYAFVVFALILLGSPGSDAATVKQSATFPEFTVQSDDSGITMSRTITTGFVYVNGNEIAGPFRTVARRDRLTVNSVAVSCEAPRSAARCELIWSRIEGELVSPPADVRTDKLMPRPSSSPVQVEVIGGQVTGGPAKDDPVTQLSPAVHACLGLVSGTLESGGIVIVADDLVPLLVAPANASAARNHIRTYQSGVVVPLDVLAKHGLERLAEFAPIFRKPLPLRRTNEEE